jgi:hypothetical protein
MVALYRDLIELRRRGAGTDGRTQVYYQDDVITLERPLDDGRRMLAVFNCSDREQEVALPEGSWQLALSTDDDRYVGRVAAEMPAAVGAAGAARGSRRRLSGDEWKTEDARAPRPAPRAPSWTAAVFTSEAE